MAAMAIAAGVSFDRTPPLKRAVMSAAAVAILGGCNAPPPNASEAIHGRYTGIGTYSPGALWSKIGSPRSAENPQMATTADDEHIIVVVDSQSGEVRECGDYSGICVSLQPWMKAVTKTQTSPVVITRRLPQIEQSPPASGGKDP